MDTISIIQNICSYYDDFYKCKGCPFGTDRVCVLKLTPEKWNRNKIDKNCQEWEENSVVLKDVFALLMPGINELPTSEHCPMILDPKWNCYILQDTTCEQCWKKFLGQRVSKDVIRKLLDE